MLLLIATGVFLGIIEGITEFLPISSTAHLILISELIHIKQSNLQKLFEVFIQSGAILAIIITYFKTIIANKELIKKIIITFIPTAILGFVLYKIIKNVFFESNLLIIFSLIGVGILFLLVEYLISKNKINLSLTLENLSYLQAFLIGIFQSLAIIPGVSRAGAVILGMLLLGFERKSAVLYSFLVAVPTVISASLFDFYKTSTNGIKMHSVEIAYLLAGFISAFLFALIAVRLFLQYLEKHNLSIFGIYRIAIGLIFFLLLL